MPDEFARGRLGGFSFQAGEGKSSSLTGWLGLGLPRLGPERGELAADFWSLAGK
jgi:hypothetical protein